MRSLLLLVSVLGLMGMGPSCKDQVDPSSQEDAADGHQDKDQDQEQDDGGRDAQIDSDDPDGGADLQDHVLQDTSDLGGDENCSTCPDDCENCVPPVVWIIGTGVSVIDGRFSPYDQIKEGDIIELTPGTRVPLNIKNIMGSADRPILIRNGDGVVEIDSADGWFGFWLQNCHFFRFTGTGYGRTYGIQITRSQNNGIIFQNKTDNFEIDHVAFYRVDPYAQSIAIQGQTTSTFSPDYDYNLDGTIDASDGTVNRENYTAHGYHFHHLFFDGGSGANLIDVPFYIGNSNYCEGVDGVLQPVIHGCQIHDLTIKNSIHKSQVGSVNEDCEVNNNLFDHAMQGPTNSQDKMALNINAGCTMARVYNNTILDAQGTGITFQGEGGYIYNNLIVRVGLAGSYYEEGITVLYRDGYTHGNSVHIFNNTIIGPVGHGIEFGANWGTDNHIQNNVVVDAPDGSINYSSGIFSASNNLTTPDIGSVCFSDPKNDLYTLTSDSPARNTGVDASAYGVAADILGTSRPQEGVFDLGAYEYVP